MGKRFIGIGFVLGVLLVLGTGCSHNLTVKNLAAYQNLNMNPLDKSISIGMVTGTSDIGSQSLIKGVAKGLGSSGAKVFLPYYANSEKPADVIATFTIQPEYKGSGWNFLINWPGFLIFTPAWNGYIYKVNYDIDISLKRGSDNTPIDSWSYPVNLDIRHAAMNRTWTEISWLEASIIAFVGGIVFTSYDEKVTPLLLEKIQNPIGDRIAQDIITRLNGCNIGRLNVSPGVSPAG